MQDAINSLCGVLDMYPETLGLKIVAANDFTLEWQNTRSKELDIRKEHFESAIEWLEWMETNLIQKQQK